MTNDTYGALRHRQRIGHKNANVQYAAYRGVKLILGTQMKDYCLKKLIHQIGTIVDHLRADLSPKNAFKKNCHSGLQNHLLF